MSFFIFDSWFSRKSLFLGKKIKLDFTKPAIKRCLILPYSLGKQFLLWVEIDLVEKRVLHNNLKNFDIIDFSQNLLLDVVFDALSRESEKKIKISLCLPDYLR